VFPYVENHNFYIEHWSLGVFWRKMRELNALFVKACFWLDPDGLFYLNPSEARQALWDYCSAWGVGGSPFCVASASTIFRRRAICFGQ
jgi:pyruvate, water dikinase